MSLIRLECGGCHTFLQVRPELAGQQGRCPKCGATVNIPAPVSAASRPIGWDSPATPPPRERTPTAGTVPDPPPSTSPGSAPKSTIPLGSSPGSSRGSGPGSSLPLSQAMAPDMMAEIARRKKSAVLVVFETPDDGSYEISRRGDANVRCYRTSDMTDANVLQVLGEIGQMTPGNRNHKGGLGLQGDDVPFELKGDRLGMTLADFKLKYARTVGGMRMPYCSDTFAGQSNSSLWSEAWHAAAGIVTGRIELPSEGASPTVAGVKSDLFLYHFIDGKLFRMTVLFDTEAFHLVREALVQKQGPPTCENKERLEMAWGNGVSTIRLTRGSMRPKKSSSLLFIHDELQKLAESRTPDRDEDL